MYQGSTKVIYCGKIFIPPNISLTISIFNGLWLKNRTVLRQCKICVIYFCPHIAHVHYGEAKFNFEVLPQGYLKRSRCGGFRYSTEKRNVKSEKGFWSWLLKIELPSFVKDYWDWKAHVEHISLKGAGRRKRKLVTLTHSDISNVAFQAGTEIERINYISHRGSAVWDTCSQLCGQGEKLHRTWL